MWLCVFTFVINNYVIMYVLIVTVYDHICNDIGCSWSRKCKLLLFVTICVSYYYLWSGLFSIWRFVSRFILTLIVCDQVFFKYDYLWPFFFNMTICDIMCLNSDYMWPTSSWLWLYVIMFVLIVFCDLIYEQWLLCERFSVNCDYL